MREPSIPDAPNNRTRRGGDGATSWKATPVVGRAEGAFVPSGFSALRLVDGGVALGFGERAVAFVLGLDAGPLERAFPATRFAFFADDAFGAWRAVLFPLGSDADFVALRAARFALGEEGAVAGFRAVRLALGLEASFRALRAGDFRPLALAVRATLGVPVFVAAVRGTFLVGPDFLAEGALELERVLEAERLAAMPVHPSRQAIRPSAVLETWQTRATSTATGDSGEQRGSRVARPRTTPRAQGNRKHPPRPRRLCARISRHFSAGIGPR